MNETTPMAQRGTLQRKNRAVFDHVDIRSYKLLYGGKAHPTAGHMALNFPQGTYANAYRDYVEFFHSDIDIDRKERAPMIDYGSYKDKYPIFCVNCEQQDETTEKPAGLTLQLDFNSGVPQGTKMFLVIYIDKKMSYALDGSNLVIN